jgi:hypothetical protein
MRDLKSDLRTDRNEVSLLAPILRKAAESVQAKPRVPVVEFSGEKSEVPAIEGSAGKDVVAHEHTTESAVATSLEPSVQLARLFE